MEQDEESQPGSHNTSALLGAGQVRPNEANPNSTKVLYSKIT